MGTCLVVMLLCMLMFFPLGFAGGAKVLPTVKVTKGKETRIINVSDLSAWQKDGWKPVSAVPDSDNADDGKFTLREAVEKARNKAVLEELVEAHEMEIEGFGDMTKAQQVEAILAYMDENEIE